MFTPLTAVPFRRKAIAQAMALCFVIPLCAVAARPFLETLDWGQVRLAWHNISPLQWFTAVLATICSVATLGRYDVTIHRVLNTGVNRRAAQACGAASVALSQTLGLGLLTGTLARWRALDGIGIVTAGSVTTQVSLSFLGAWLILFALAGLASPSAFPLPSLVYKASLFSAICLILYTALKRYINVAGHRIRLPSLRAIAILITFAAFDTGFATLAFWLLLPSDIGIEFSTLFPICLACLGISLVGNTPAGVGSFEITLLWALQFVDVNEVLASLIAFRIVYFVLPACASMAYLIRPMRSRPLRQANILLAKAVHPETASGLQTGQVLVASSGHVIGAVARTTQSTVMIFDPALSSSSSFAALKSAAKRNATSPLFYKCGARRAAQFRRHGLKVVRIAQDALIDLRTAQISSPKRRGLRRKIRAAQKAAIAIKPLNLRACTIEEIEDVDLEWQKENGTPRGFSMGRVCPQYLAT